MSCSGIIFSIKNYMYRFEHVEAYTDWHKNIARIISDTWTKMLSTDVF